MNKNISLPSETNRKRKPPTSNGVKKAIVFCNGDLADLSRVKRHIKKDTLLIGCDGGASHILALRLTPHVVIGDMDSLSRRILRALQKKKVELIRYPRDKLYTDSELGVALAVARGCRDVILAGVHGTSTDHLVGNIFMLAKKRFASVRLRIIEGREEIELVRARLRIRGKKGDDVSLIPVGRDAAGVSAKGLFYPLKNEVLRSGSARGIRNKMTGKTADISVRNGSLLVVHRLGDQSPSFLRNSGTFAMKKR